MKDGFDYSVGKLEGVIHFYLGGEALFDNKVWKINKVGAGLVRLIRKEQGQFGKWVEVSYDQIKVVVRPISDMTEKEALGLCTLKVAPMTVLRIILITDDGIQFEYESFEKNKKMYLFPDELTPTMFRLLIKNQFDLFSLIKSGFGIKKQITNTY